MSLQSYSQGELEELVYSSFTTEVHALKPGNVSRYSEGHDMRVEDFIKSAELVTPILCRRTSPLGKRILESVKITRAAIGCNTNLGMILLFAPIVMAAEAKESRGDLDTIQNRLGSVVKNSTKSDVAMVFQAICEANPGGLGHSDNYDVHLYPRCSLQEAMEAAMDRDNIAKQYVTLFSDIFILGFNTLKRFTDRWNSVEWAAVACYMNFLSSMTDSHIARKYGNKLAEQIKARANKVFNLFENKNNPEDAFSILLEFDKELKNANINPGTSADLTAASILVYKLGEE